MSNPPIPTNPQPISAEVYAGMSATDHDEDCVMHFWSGFLVGIVTALAVGGSIIYFS